MVTLRSVLLLLCLACAVAPIRGQDFDLNDAFDDPQPTMKPATKKPAIPNKPPPPADDGFNLGDAIGGEDHVTKKPVPRPKPGGSGGEFGDADLFDAAGVDPNKPHKPSGRASDPSGDDEQSNHANTEQAQPSVIAGIVSAVGVALVGAVSSFIAYQKKKLCFSGSGGDPENVNMEHHGGNKAEPQGFAGFTFGVGSLPPTTPRRLSFLQRTLLDG